MKSYFITGTDTGIGKTTVSAAICLALKASYWKPIQSGVAAEISDREQVQHYTGLSDSYFCASNYVLQASLSPDQAAEIENIKIDLAVCQIPAVNTRHFVVEGAGGVFVPLNENESMLDLINQLQMPVIIVSRGTLGTVNHTLLTIEALRQRNIPIHGVVFSGKLNPANQLAIEKWGQVKVLFQIPHFEHLTRDLLHEWVEEHKKRMLEVLL